MTLFRSTIDLSDRHWFLLLSITITSRNC